MTIQVYLKMAEIILQKKIDKEEAANKLYIADRHADQAEYSLSVIQSTYDNALTHKEFVDKQLLSAKNIYYNIFQEYNFLQQEFDSYLTKEDQNIIIELIQAKQNLEKAENKILNSPTFNKII